MPPQIDAKKNFLVCNVIVAALFVIGNLTLPSVFWVDRRIAPTQLCLECFFVGVLASEVVIVGVYASFCSAFYVVRLCWSILASVVCSLLVSIGIYIAESGPSHESSLLMLPILAYAVFVNLVTIGVGACVRWFSGLNLTLGSDSEEQPKTKSFNLMFLFQLTFVVAILLLVFRTFTLRVPQSWDLRAVVVIVSHAALHIFPCIGLLLFSLHIAMTSRNRKKRLAILGVLIVLGTLPLVLVCQILIAGSSYSFLRWWLETQAFFLGFATSLLVVFSLWRWAGLRFVRANDQSGFKPLGETGS